MKTSWAVLLFAAAVTLGSVSANCKSACQSQLVHSREEACQKWRERLPRPDLFNHCGQGFNKGKSAGCNEYCKESPDVGAMKSLRLDACSSLKGVPPHERQQSCQAGFSAALDLAKGAAIPSTDQDEVKNTEGSQDTETKRKLQESSEKKAKVKINKVIPENDRRNILNDARKEAEAAFVNTQDMKGGEL